MKSAHNPKPAAGRKTTKRIASPKTRRLLKPTRQSRYAALLAATETPSDGKSTAPANSLGTKASPGGIATPETSVRPTVTRGMIVLATDRDCHPAYYPAKVQGVDQTNVVLTWEGEWSSLGRFNREITQITLLPTAKSPF